MQIQNQPIYELLVAMNEDGIIGITDAFGIQRIPWSHDIGKVDMQHFREKTMGNILIMGRKTFDSLPVRPLPGRIHIVVTRTPSKYDEKYGNIDTVFFSRLEKVEDTLETILGNFTKKRVFICGGEEIYRMLLPKCERLYITLLNCPVVLSDGETASRFPIYTDYLNEFQEVESLEATETCVFKTFERISSPI
jgi:dihydrofolate reductase